MKILMDENPPRKLAGHLEGHECRTALECDRSGKKNGELLDLAGGLLDALLTPDKNMHYQHDMKSGRLAVRIIRARSNRIQDLLPVIPACLVALAGLHPRQVVRVRALPSR
jgi:hypothetical protein